MAVSLLALRAGRPLPPGRFMVLMDELDDDQILVHIAWYMNIEYIVQTCIS
jgi:hypothetical protein